MSDEDRKIIIDEDWKARVQREKDEAENAPAVSPDAPAEAEAKIEPFQALTSYLTMQSLLFLGAIAPRETGEPILDLPTAREFIGMLTALRDKTAGNLTPAEQGELTSSIAELQQIFVVRSQQVQEAALHGVGFDPAQRR